MIRAALTLAALVAALAFAGPAAADRAGPWQVQAGRIVSPCPHGFLCKLTALDVIEPNYGQALKEARLLAATGWTVLAVVQVQP